MWKFSNQLLLWQERQCRNLGLTHIQATVLVMVVEKPCISQYDLAQELCVSSGTASKAVELLLDKGYISRRKVWKGRISYQLKPTHRGCFLYEQLQRLQREMMTMLTKDSIACENANLPLCFSEMKKNMEVLSHLDFKPEKPYQMPDIEVLTSEDWEKMKSVDIHSVDKKQLVDLRDVVIDPTLPVEERMISFLRQIKNPYCFRIGDIAVKLNFQSGGPTFQDAFKEIIWESVQNQEYRKP